MLPTLSRKGRGFVNPFEWVDRELGNWANQWFNGDEQRDVLGAYPVDIREDENYIYVEAEMPGFKKDEIDVTLESGVLHIQAQRTIEKQESGQRHLTERRFNRISRSFTMPNAVDEGKVDAGLKDGVLHLKLHKREEVKPRKIEVK